MSFNLYTFGCSFTKYLWPTWADILGKYANEYTNYGKEGVGNYFIFHQLIHLLAEHSFKDNDVIMICWSNYFREDRIKNKKWLHSSGLAVTEKEEFDNTFLDRFFDLDHYIERDRVFIIAAIELLESKKINYIMFSMDDIFLEVEKSSSFFIKFLKKNFSSKLKSYLNIKLLNKINKSNRYNNYEDKILPSMNSVLSIEKSLRPKTVLFDSDKHPTPKEHLYYVEKILLPKLKFPITISEEHRKEILKLDKKLYK